MRVVFLLPSYGTSPIGGFRVVYELANGLAGRGYRITVVHPRTVPPPTGHIDRVKSRLWPLKVRLRDRSAPRWATLSPEVRVLRLPYLNPDWIPAAEALVATAWPTAEVLRAVPRQRGERRYLVQDFEVWMTEGQEIRERMTRTFRAGIPMAATSLAVERMLSENGVSPAASIRPGVDPGTFHIESSPAERRAATVAFPVRRDPLKGAAEAIEACAIARERIGDALQVSGFGYSRPPDLPSWIAFHEAPSDDQLRGLLNSVAIFVLSSRFEGFGMPGLEAMACGAALVTTDSIGVREYARHESTALLVPPGEPERLARAIERLRVEPRLRARLVHAGAQMAARYEWGSAIDELEPFLRP